MKQNKETCLKHITSEWEILNTSPDKTIQAKKQDGVINGVSVEKCNIQIIGKNIYNSDQLDKKIAIQKLSGTEYYGYGVDDNGIIYIYSEYKNSISVASLLNQMPNNKFDEDLASALGFLVAKALGRFHKDDIIHGNINCENIMLLYDDNGIITAVSFIGWDEIISKIGGNQLSNKLYKSDDLKGFRSVFNEIAGENITNFWYESFSVDGVYQDAVYMFQDTKAFEYIISIDKESIPDKSRVIMALYDKPITFGSIPDSVKYLSLPSFNQIIEIGSIPDSVENLKLPSFNQLIEIGSIPGRVRFLELSSLNQNPTGLIPKSVTNLTLTSFNQLITIGAIPDSVRYLSLPSFNQIIEIRSIPDSVENLKLPSFNQLIKIGSIPEVRNLSLPSFNQIITFGSIPDSVKYLSLPSFNQIIEIGSIPDSVENLKLPSFNQLIEIGSIPDSVRYLELSSFNQNPTGLIPKSVTDLTLTSFNQLITVGAIPDNVVHLELSSFNQIITTGSIPDSVTNLKLKSFDQIITIGSIPDSVRYLELSSFNQIITTGSIPDSVRNLKLLSFNQPISNFPKSKVNLTLGPNFNNIESLSNIWLSSLKFIDMYDEDKIKNLVNYISPSLELDINGKIIDVPLLFRDNFKLVHSEKDWTILNNKKIYSKEIDQNTTVAEKLDGIIGNTTVSECIIEKITHNEFCIFDRLKDSFKYYGIGKNENGLYMYTEYFKEAMTITDQLKSLQPINENDIISFAIEITKAIKIIHSKQIIHGNINCDNILLIPNENGNKSIKIIGLKSSLLFNGSPTFRTLIGLETHMAPEVKLQNGLASYKSDIWSLGCTLIEMAGGNLKHINENGIPIIPNHLSNYLRNIIQRCLVTNQNGRFSAKSLLRHLEKEHKEYKNYLFEGPITYGSIESIPYESNINLELTNFNEELKKWFIPYSVKSLSLPSFNQRLHKESIPSSVTCLSFKKIREIGYRSIPSSVTYLDLGDEFDFQNNGDNIPDYSILTLRIGFKFTKEIQQRSIPKSVTNLQLDNYNIKLNSNSIPSTVTYLTLGSKFTDFESLKNLPSSIINLKFDTKSTELIKDIPEFIKEKSITSLLVNGKNIEIIFLKENFISNSETLLPSLLNHNKFEWGPISHLGEGGFSLVCKAKLNGKINGYEIEECAFKIIENDKFKRNEIDILQLLNDCEYSIKYYGCGTDESGKIYIYMEYSDQLISIADKLKQQPNQRFEDLEIISFGVDIVTALINIHNYNIIHRDIKCANILFVNDNKDGKRGIKFIDYGLANLVDKNNNYSFSGTETHLAPEIKMKSKKSFKSDIYSIGCTLIEMAGGDLKFRNEDGNPTIPSHVSFTLKRIIQRCIHTNINARLDSKQLLNLLTNGKTGDNELHINKKLTLELLLNEPLTIHSIVDKSITILSLPLFEDSSIEIYSIPSTVTHLSFKILKQIQDPDSIPSSVTYLDLGDEFDFQNNGDNIPDDSILTLRIGFKFTKIIHQRSIPTSVTDLQLDNYNLKLNSNSIPKTVTYLTLGSNFTDFESLKNLPPSVISLVFGTKSTELIKDILENIKGKSITSLKINGDEKLI